MKRNVFAVLLPMLLLLACKPALVEEVTESYPDGSPRVVRYYEEHDGIRDLVQEKAFYPDHKLMYEGAFKDNRKHGKWTVYYKNGNRWSVGYFKDGLDDGKRTTYHENGKKNFEGKYNKGEMVGKWRFYDENGKLIKEIDYTKK
jgi:antitoxin component YwqK of YwqJK toxin-antitoxin module